MEYQIAAKWWIERLEYIPDHPDAARRDLENEEKMASLVQNLAEGIKREVDKWGDIVLPYSIDTTFDPREVILEDALKAADVSGVQFPQGVVMEFTPKNIIVNVRTVLVGEE